MARTNASRVKKACKAMKLFGFPEDRVKLVLRNLLNEYDNEWDFIEVDDFKVLLEALIEDSVPEVTENKKKEEEKNKSNDVATNRGTKKALEQTQLVIRDEDDDLEEDEAPLKKRLRQKRDNNSSLSSGSPVSKKAREEEPNCEAEDDDNGMPVVPPLKRYLRRRGERGSAVTSQALPVIYLPGGPLHTECNNSGALVILNNDSFTEHKPMILDTGNCSSAPMPEMEKSNLLVEEQNEELEVTTSMDVPSSTVEESSKHKVAAAAFELASSTSGEAKISLTFEPATGETFSRLPSMEDLRRAMEEKCLKSYKVVHPGFSVLGFMNDICSCYIDLAKNSVNQSLETSTVSDLSKGGEQSGATEMSMGLVVVPECKISAEGWKEISNVKDITAGEENMKIPWVNEINDEVPSVFRYMSQSFVFQDAAVKFTLSSFSDKQCCSSSCIDDCLVSATLCNCAIAVDNGFAYTADGVLKEDFLEERISEARDLRKQVLHFCKECPLEKAKKEEILEPCKGHLKRKAIKECCIKCGCTKRCGNKVVQRGIHSKLQVFFTPNGKGWGLRTLERLPKGAFVCEYIGEIMTITELHQRYFEDKLSAPMILDAFWGSEEGLEDNKALCLDGSLYGNISRFLNHRCLDANLIEIPVHVETPDQHYYHLAFFTTRDIDAMEELTWDYGVAFDDDDYPMKLFDCLCGSRFCRSVKRSRKSKRLMIKA